MEASETPENPHESAKRKNYSSKSENLPIRFSPEEIKAFDAEAKELNITRSKLIRQKIKNGRVTVYKVDETMVKLLYELNKVGVNLNQIAHKLNENRVSNTHFEKELAAVIVQIKTLFAEVKSKIKDTGLGD